MEEKLHRPFMRKVLGVCRTTPVAAIMCELNRMPLAMQWLKQVMNFWNKACRRPADDYLRASMAENVFMSSDTSTRVSARKRLWSYHFMRCMQYIGVQCVSAAGDMMALDVSVAMDALRSKWQAHDWNVVNSMTGAWLLQPCAVKAAPEGLKGFKMLTYSKWFRWDEGVNFKNHFSYCLSDYTQIRVLAQFRLGSHWLQVQQGRFKKQPRAQRTCACCSSEVEDEMHIFKCPLYAELRDELNVAVPSSSNDACMRECMNKNTPTEWVALANYLSRCRAMSALV
jgi:hypothetical protein